MHACCMHTCQDWVSQNWIDMMSVHDAQIIRVFFNHHLTGLHAIFLHEVQNVCHLSRLCVLVVIPKSKWYVAFQTPTLCYFYFAKEEVLPPFGNDNPFGSQRPHFGRIKNRIAPAETSWNLRFRGVSTIFVTHQLLSKKLVWKKVTSSKKGKVGKNTELFIQIGIIFVKKASSWLFSEHFYDTYDTFLKSSDFGDCISKIQNYAFLTKKLRKSIFKLLWIIFFK